ncbi:flavin reductase family protein [Basfia succiniciproducens]|uniref:flavin reductase family protein n=1 Tax=Basfia succiniciproducens TaxID=653940 RepID=UPI0008D7CD66|nr:flavin reductase [Basfia succiniciproducens]SEQ59145.1 NADH-FMN oxidoreductase RutF, flavin reductase (DIM6/NTAB) family [Basfia succiniciproducens]
MAIKPVEISKAYRLVQLGSTTMLSAKHDGDADVMAAAWVGLGGPNKIIAYIGTQAYTRQLVEKSGYFIVHIPTVQQMETVLYVGEHSKHTMPNKLDNLPLFYQEEFDIPMVEGSAGWLVCQVIPNPQQEQNYDSFMGEIIAAWADDRVFDGRHWLFDTAPDELRTVHYVAGGQFYAIGKGTKFDHGPGQD